MKKHTLFAIVMLMAVHCFAQAPHGHDVSVWMRLNSGVCLTEHYDNGAVPFTDLGVGLTPGFGTVVEWDQCHAEVDLRVPASMMLAMGGYNIPIDVRLEFLYRFYEHPDLPLRLWAGGGLQSFTDIHYSPALMNAAMTTSSFLNVMGSGVVEYDFAPLRGTSHKFLTAHAKLSLPLVGTARRPGFSYMGNYTSDLNSVNTLYDGQETFSNCFSGLHTELGLTLNLTNGNRIGVSYRWDYLTTAHRGTYRFDSAIHSLNLTCLFNLY